MLVALFCLIWGILGVHVPEVAVRAAGSCCPRVPYAHRCSLALLAGKDRAQVLQPSQREELLGRRSVWDRA